MKKPIALAASALLLIVSHASAFELKDFSGEPTTVQSVLPLKQWTLIMLWSIECVACEEQKPMINAFHTDHHLSNARVIGVSTDGDRNLPSVIEHVKSRPTTFDNYVTLSNTFEQGFAQITGKSFIGTPTYMLYNPDGLLIATHAGIVNRALLERIVGEPTHLQVVPADLMR